MTDPPLQAWTRYIAIDIHKHYLMIGGIDAHKRIVLQPRKVELQRWREWAKANLHPTDAVVIEATIVDPLSSTRDQPIMRVSNWAVSLETLDSRKGCRTTESRSGSACLHSRRDLL